MKIEKEDVVYEKNFTPFELNIVIETLGEAEEFYNIFRYAKITRGFEHLDQEQIRGAMGFQSGDNFSGSSLGSYSEFVNRVNKSF